CDRYAGWFGNDGRSFDAPRDRRQAMTQQVVNPKPIARTFWRRFPATFEQRDLIVILFGVVLLIVFLSKALQFNLLGNLQVLTMWMAAIGIVAVGQTWVIITGGIDLSVGSIVAFSSVITAYLVTQGWNAGLAAFTALAIATAIGWLHGVLISKYKLAPF